LEIVFRKFLLFPNLRLNCLHEHQVRQVLVGALCVRETVDWFHLKIINLLIIHYFEKGFAAKNDFHRGPANLNGFSRTVFVKVGCVHFYLAFRVHVIDEILLLFRVLFKFAQKSFFEVFLVVNEV
jgi:hypothetical protein